MNTITSKLAPLMTSLKTVGLTLGGAFLFLFGLSFISPSFSFAAAVDIESTQLMASIDDPFGKEEAKGVHATKDDVTLEDSIVDLINYLLLFIGILLLIIIIYAGVLIILSDGEEEAVTKGRKMIMYSVIGMVIIILSWSIVEWMTDIGTNAGQ